MSWPNNKHLLLSQFLFFLLFIRAWCYNYPGVLYLDCIMKNFVAILVFVSTGSPTILQYLDVFN